MTNPNAYEARLLEKVEAITAQRETFAKAVLQACEIADADPLTQRLQRIARKADVMRLDAKARGNLTLAADASEILALANDAAQILRRAK